MVVALRPVAPATKSFDKPAAPAGLLAGTRELWEDYWESDVARAAEKVDVPTARRLFRYMDMWERAMRVVRKQLVTEGSKGQLRSNPLAAYALKLEDKISKLSTELGLTPMARARLGIAAGNALLTADQVNRMVQEPDESERKPEPNTDADFEQFEEA